MFATSSELLEDVGKLKANKNETGKRKTAQSKAKPVCLHSQTLPFVCEFDPYL